MGFLRRTKQNRTNSEPLKQITPLPPAETDDATGDRYCSSDVIVLPAGNNRHLVHSVTERSSQFLESEMAVLLNQCQTFKTLKEHAEAFAPVFELSPRGMKGVYLTSVALQFSELIDRGLLISQRDLLEQCKRVAAEVDASPPSICTISVVTRDRPEKLRRCLQSYLGNTKQYGREAEFVVADDSVEREARRQTREMLREIAQREDVCIRYAGEEEKRRYAGELVSGGDLPPEVVEFAMFDPQRYGYRPGANRNSLLLDTAGKMFFSADDDTVCRLVTVPEMEDLDDYDDGQPEANPLDLWFFPDRETALQESRFIDDDFLRLHEQLLGRPVADCIAAHGSIGVLNLEQLGARDLGPIQSGTARVLLTFNGVLGDSGWRSPAAFALMNRKSRQRLARSDADYVATRFTREILRMAERPCISRRSWFLSTALAYDNSNLLPPFMPVGRGEDSIFADTLKMCFESSFLADLPQAVVHMPPEERSHTLDQILEAASSIPLALVISACVSSFQPSRSVSEQAARMRALGQHLIDIGSMTISDFEELVRIHVWQFQSNYLSKLEAELGRYEQLPDLYIDDLQQYLDTMREGLKKREYIIPADLPMGLSIGEANAMNRNLITKFGELLRAWPDMVEKARQLREREQQLAVRL